MNNTDSLSVSDKLLLAGLEIEEVGRIPFSAEDLVVGAWRMFPSTFGLSGHPSPEGAPLYPDSNRVFVEIMGSKPIRKRGLLVKVGSKMYQLTEAGRQRAALLAGRAGSGSALKAGLARDVEIELRRLLASRAVAKFCANRAEDITFHDACTFWSISPRSSAIELAGRFANIAKIVASALQVAQRGPVSFSHGGQTYGSEELGLLSTVHEELVTRFQTDLAVIAQRTDER